MKELENLLAKTKPDKVHLKHFADALYTAIYLNPHAFNMEKIDKDTFSDFLLAMYNVFMKIPLYYSPKRGQLFHYVRVILMRNYKSWIRNKMQTVASEKSIYNCLTQEYAESECAEIEEEYGNKDIIHTHELICETGLKKLLSIERILLLAFKSSYLLSEKHIKKLAAFTGYSEEKLWETKMRLDAANSKRIENYERYKKSTIYSFMLKNRYSCELEHVNPESARYKHLKNAHLMQNELWHKKTAPKNKPAITVPNDILAAEFKVNTQKVNTTVLYTRRKIRLNTKK